MISSSTKSNMGLVRPIVAALFIAFAALLAVFLWSNHKAVAQESNEQRYIVVFRDQVQNTHGIVREHARNFRARPNQVYGTVLKGYAASIPNDQVAALRRDPRVAYVEPDGIATASITQAGATWGLDRIDQLRLPLSSTFTYNATGSGVKIYIIDSGIRSSHQEFGGRVVDGFDAVDNALPADDCNGHGTHVAGTAGGSTYGVAKGATLVPVRVLDCNGSGYWSWVIAGIDYATANRQPGQPTVANMSLGGGTNRAVDDAVRRSIAAGVSYSLAAGNNAANSCSYSPARVSEAMTVSATDRSDLRPYWANYGTCVDWFAPGVSITSAWHTSNSATNTISGTSMAAPHTAGVAALYLQKSPTATPKKVRDTLYILTSKRVVKGSSSVNSHLLYTNY